MLQMPASRCRNCLKAHTAIAHPGMIITTPLPRVRKISPANHEADTHKKQLYKAAETAASCTENATNKQKSTISETEQKGDKFSRNQQCKFI